MIASPKSERPNLLYVGDVPVEASYHGSALLYRLFQDYDPAKLCIVETNHLRSQPERRLASVRYLELNLGWPRPLKSRFSNAYSLLLLGWADHFHWQLLPMIDDFLPEAVVTVSHGFSWRTAARFASLHGLPLHLICHDDLPGVASADGFWTRWKYRVFGDIYRQACSRHCVSPYMRDEYFRRYGVDGEVLFPSRSADCPEFDSPPPRLFGDCARPTAIYAGSINSPGYAESIRQLAECLEGLGGRLLVFSPLDAHDLKRAGLDRPNIQNCGLVPFDELIRRCREQADFLYVPMSFEPHDRPNMELSFPSKLTDYTATGVPLLIRGPAYCSAVRWVSEHPGIAECVRTEEKSDLKAAIGRLTESGARRFEMAEMALKVGRETFSFSTVHETFLKALREGGNAGCA